MKSFFLMIGFMTRLPVPKIEFTEERFQKATKFMPLAGLVIGAVLVLFSLLFTAVQAPPLIRGAILTCVYIIVTGGLHFDGLADTCDGVFSGRSREQSLEIMRDSHIGVFGMLGLLMAGLMYFAVITEAPLAALLVCPLCGRACCLISASLSPYARAEGMGKATAMDRGLPTVMAAAVSLAGASLLTAPFMMIPIVESSSRFAGQYAPLLRPYAGIALAPVCSFIGAAAAVLVTAFMTAHFRKKLGGVTGDTFGAVIEVSAIAYLFAFTIFYRILPL